MKHTTTTILTALLLPSVAAAGDHCPTASGCQDSAAQHLTHTDHMRHDHSVATPTGVMGGHAHDAGEVMFSYRYMFMNMDGLRSGSSSATTADVTAAGYMNSPADMQMEMHMIGAMYGLTDRITLMAMTNYLSNTMDMNMASGMPMSMESEGLGDTSLGAIHKTYQAANTSILTGLSVIAPTGSTDETMTMMMMSPMGMPMSMTMAQPYGMQLGSGTWALKPSVTYLGKSDKLSWGAQLSSIIYLGTNDNGYRLGNKVDATAWTAYKLTDDLSLTARVAGSSWGDINGAHDGYSMMAPTMTTTLNTANSGGDKVDAYIGASYTLGLLKTTVEYGQTLWQDLDGIQLGYDWTLNLGASISF